MLSELEEGVYERMVGLKPLGQAIHAIACVLLLIFDIVLPLLLAEVGCILYLH